MHSNRSKPKRHAFGKLPVQRMRVASGRAGVRLGGVDAVSAERNEVDQRVASERDAAAGLALIKAELEDRRLKSPIRVQQAARDDPIALPASFSVAHPDRSKISAQASSASLSRACDPCVQISGAFLSQAVPDGHKRPSHSHLNVKANAQTCNATKYSSCYRCQAKFRWSDSFLRRFNLFSHKREDPIVRVQQTKQQTSWQGRLLLIALHFDSARDREAPISRCCRWFPPAFSANIHFRGVWLQDRRPDT